MLGSLWLVMRLARGSRSEVAGQFVLFATACLLAFLALATAAVPVVLAHHADRIGALTPTSDTSDEAPSPGALLLFEPRATEGERWNGHTIIRQYFAAGDRTAPAIPGTTAVPRVGEYLASPALFDLINNDETVAALFATLKPAGYIGPSGLVDPHEYRAIIGIPREGPLLQAVSAFGGHPIGSHDDDKMLNTSIAGLTGAMVWLPAFALVAVTTRLRSGSRRERFRSLRNVGLSRRLTRLLYSAECTVVAAPGAAFGVLPFEFVAGQITRVPSTSFGFYSVDTHLSLPVLLASASAAWLLLAVAAWFSHRDEESVARPPDGHGHRIEAFGLTVVMVAVGFLLALPLLKRLIGTPAVFGMWIACAAAAIGLAVAGPAIVERVGRSATRHVHSGAGLVGIRIGNSVSGSTTRLGSLACVVIVLMLGCLSFTAILNGGTYDAWKDRLARETKVPIVVSDLTGRLQLADIARLGVSNGLAQVQQAHLQKLAAGASTGHSNEGSNGDNVQVVYASCDDLTGLIGRAPQRCATDSPQWINHPVAAAVEGSNAEISGHHSFPVPAETQVAQIRGLPSELDGAILADPKLAPKATTNSGLFLLLVDPNDLSTSMASLSSMVPALQFDLGDLGRANPDFRPFPSQIEWLIAGCLISFLIAALALLASLLGEAPQRAERLRGLRILGARRLIVIRAHLWSTTLPLTILGAASAAIGLVVCLCLRSFDDRATIPWAAAAYSVAGSMVTALVLGLATVRSSLHRVGRSGGIEG